MGIKFRNVDVKSGLRKYYVPLEFRSTATFVGLSAAPTGYAVVPFASRFKKAIVCGQADITASNGLNVLVENQQKSANYVNSTIWSQGAGILPETDWSKDQTLSISATADFGTTAGSMFTFTLSATAGNVPLGGVLEFDISDKLEK